MLFPFTRCENLSTRLLPFRLPFSPPASKSFLNASFYSVYFFLESNSILFTARPVFAVVSLLWIKFLLFLSPFQMSLTNPSQALKRCSLLSTFARHTMLSDIALFFTNIFQLASLLALFDGLNLFFLTVAFS